MEIACIWLAGMILVWWLANKRGRNPPLWTAISLFISPLLAFVIVFVLADLKKKEQDELEALMAARLMKEHPDQDPLRRAKADQDAKILAMGKDR